MPISVRYPLVEAVMGALWGGVAILYAMDSRTPAGIVLVSMLLALSLIDLDTMRLPNSLVAPLAGAGILLAVAAQISGKPFVPLIPAATAGVLSNPLAVSLLGAVCGAGLSLAIAGAYSAVRKAEGFGMGDVKLLGAIGIYLGPYVLMVLFIASLIGAVWAVLSQKVETMRTQMPFGPFIAIATGIVMVLGGALWGWYAGLIGVA